MKYKEGDRGFTKDMATGVYNTINEKFTILAYSKERGKYLVEYDNYIGGHVFKYKDVASKIGRGLFLEEREITPIDKWDQYVKGEE